MPEAETSWQLAGGSWQLCDPGPLRLALRPTPRAPRHSHSREAF